MVKERIHYIDVAKGIAIFLVVLGHCAATTLGHHSRVFYTIYSFHMPFWFFLSGLLYSIKDWQSFLSGKVKALLLPYLFFSGLNVFSFQFFNLINHSDWPVYARFGGLWFLLALFYVVVVYFVLDTYCLRKITLVRKRIVITILSCVFLLLGMFGGKDQEISSLSTTMVCFFFFHCGVLLKGLRNKLNLWIDNRRWVLLCLALILIVLLAYSAPINPDSIDVNQGRYGNKFLFVPQAFLGIFGFLFLSAAINKSKTIEYLGRNSLLILVIHIPLWRLFDTLFRNIGWNHYTQMAIMCACVLTVTLFIIMPINRFLPELKGQFDFDGIDDKGSQ